MTIIADIHALRQGAAWFWPDAPETAYVVCSYPCRGHFYSKWFPLAHLSRALQWLQRHAPTTDTYVSMGLRHPSCRPDVHKRGESADVSALGSLWIELDHTGGVHAAANLPTPLQLTRFLRTLPFPLSLQIDSGGGIHGHLLLKECWLLDTPAEQARASTLLRRLQRTVQLAAETHGWRVDTTSDLARVLRLPGTWNHKRAGDPRPVTILESAPVRYNPSDLEDAPWLAPDVPPMSPRPPLAYPPGDVQRLLDRCAWVRHCYDDAAVLDEPTWYAALGILGRCEQGDALVHSWSAPYPRYTPEETQAKLLHALAAAGPRTCAKIRTTLGGEPYCRTCPAWGSVRSPITLSLDNGARLRLRAAAWRTRQRERR